jgi:hypothetical protein
VKDFLEDRLGRRVDVVTKEGSRSRHPGSCFSRGRSRVLMEKDPAIYVHHILEAIANIETDTAGYDFEKFRADRRARQLVERNLEIVSVDRKLRA